MTSLKTRIETPRKIYVNSLHENSSNQRNISKILNNQDKEFDNIQLTNLDSTPIIRNPPLGKEITNKKNFDDVLDKNTIRSFNQRLEAYLKISVGDTV